MVEKVAIMVLKVDLRCRKCFMKVKKVLSKYPQIRDQWYDEKIGIVTIKVICCNPEWVRDSLCCEGAPSIKSIEIVEPQKPVPLPEMLKKEPEKQPKASSVLPEPSIKDSIPPPPPAAKFPEPTPVSVQAYPSPAVSVGLHYGGGLGGSPGFYGRPIYDSYGWSGPCYVGSHHEWLCEEEESWCTIN